MADPRYRGQHTRLRAEYQTQIDAGHNIRCTNPNCLHPDIPISTARNTPLSLELGHNPDGISHRGPEHAVCNRSEGGQAGIQARNARQHQTWTW